MQNQNKALPLIQQNDKDMTTSTVQIINTPDQTEYTFDVLATNTFSRIDSYSAFVQKESDNNFDVVFVTDGERPKYKSFSDETAANLYAMKLLMKYKKSYNA